MLINCPECNKEISDKVKACPHCGYPLVEEETASEAQQPQQVEVTGVKIQNRNAGKIFTIAVILLVVAALAFFGLKYLKDQKAQKDYEADFNQYIDNLQMIQLLMLDGGSDAEDLTILTRKVWRNAIYEDRDSETDKFTRPNGRWVEDFNEALLNLYTDTKTISTIARIESNQESVRELIKELQSPPKGLEKSYDTVTDLYSAYKGLTDLAIDPTGSLTSFSESVNNRISDFVDLVDKLNNQMPEKFPDS